MHFLSAGRVSMAALLLITLCGCFRYQEGITVDENGKGTASYTMSRPKRGVVDKLSPYVRDFDGRFEPETALKDLPPGITAEPVRRTEVDERIETTVSYKFDDISAFAAWAAKTQSPFNNISIERKKTAIHFSRRFAMPDKENMERVRKYGPDVTLLFKFTGPGSLGQQNADRIEGNTVTWELKAPELFENGGKTFRAEYEFGTSWLHWLLLGLAIFIAVDWFIIFKFLKARKDKEAA